MPKSANADSDHSFGRFLRLLRKRARITQRELGIATGYSEGYICRFELGKRPPELTTLVALFFPALGLDDKPRDAARLIELAALARNEDLTNKVVKASITTNSGSEPRELPESNVLIGRDAHIREVIALLRRSDTRLLSLVGPPGVGKTRLSLAVAEQITADFADGMAFVALDALTSAEQAASAIAIALNIESTGTHSASAALLAGAHKKHALLVLDNAEHLDDLPLLIGNLIAAAPKLIVLVTTRMRLRLRGEQHWNVPPLALPKISPHIRPQELAAVASVGLFVSRANAVQPAFELNEENALAVAALCVRLDGLPLAIELMAARTRLFSPQALLKRFASIEGDHDRLHWLERGPRDAAPRHESLARAVHWSYDLLDDAARSAFCRLAVFADGCDFDAARAVCQTNLAVLEQLVDASLLQYQPQSNGEPRFALLQTLQVFADHQLGNAQLAVEAKRNHAAHFADLAQRLFVGVRGEQQLAWLARGAVEHNNFRAALTHAIAVKDADTAIALAGGIWWFWYRRGFLREGLTWLEQVLALPHDTIAKSKDTERRRAIALNGAGAISAELGDFATAMVYHEAGLEIRRQLADKVGESVALHNMGLVARCLGDYPRAMQLFEQALDKQPAAVDMANIGITAYEWLKHDEALMWLERALAQAAREKDAWSRAFVLGNLAEVARVTTDLPRALRLAEESLSLFRSMDDAFYTYDQSRILAKIAFDLGDFSQARAQALISLNGYVEMDDQHGIANALFVLARLALRENEGAQAARMFGKVVALRVATNRVVPPCQHAEDNMLLDALRAQLGDAACDTLLRDGAAQMPKTLANTR